MAVVGKLISLVFFHRVLLGLNGSGKSALWNQFECIVDGREGVRSLPLYSASTESSSYDATFKSVRFSVVDTPGNHR